MKISTSGLWPFSILFTGLKLTGYINWSWFWVLAPLWLPFAIIGVIIASVMTCLAINHLFMGGSK